MTQRTLFDPTARKHGGNEESEAAFQRLLPVLGHSRAEVYRVIHEAGPAGLTSKEAAKLLGKELNRISGRFTELSLMGRIYRTTSRRDGAAVWRVA